ncbi:MAG: DUF2189 domain-containing protein [Rhodobacteraceae bacterium]|nr:DUF2189 domain-containing protein [Paracoccaceae bacterium]
MEATREEHASELPEINTITTADLFECLKSGWNDYKRAPAIGFMFSAFYVLGGYVIVSVLFFAGEIWWVMPLTVGFPLLAPFAGVGFYATSCLIEHKETVSWRRVLTCALLERKRQIPWVGAIIVIWFLLYMLISHAIFAITMGLTALTNITNSFGLFFTPSGIGMLIAEVVVGAGFAFALFSITLVSLPLLLEREVDFVTGIVTSVRAVMLNFGVLMVWAFIIAVIMFVSMIPLLLGLFIAMPVLGHATWHLYRKLLDAPEVPKVHF